MSENDDIKNIVICEEHEHTPIIDTLDIYNNKENSPNNVYSTGSTVKPFNSPISDVEPFNTDDIYTNYTDESYNSLPMRQDIEANNLLKLAVYSKENNSNNKIEKSNIPDYCNYIDNLIKDRNLVEKTRHNITQLLSRGIDVQLCLQPICDQEDVCNNRVDNQLHHLRHELETLKRKDDRIKSNINIDNLIHSLEDKSVVESFKIVIDIYDSLYLNLLEDIDVLNRAKQDILGYINLGLGLDDAVNTIDNEINDIKNVLCSSKERLDEHIKVAKDESNLIV